MPTPPGNARKLSDLYDALPVIAVMSKLDTIVKKIDSSANAVTVATLDGSTIDGGASASLTTQWQALRLIADTANWLTW